MNIKKKYLILSSLFLIASCAPTQGDSASSDTGNSTGETPSIQNILKTLQGSFSIEAEVTETDTILAGNQSVTVYHNVTDIASSSKKYRQTSYKQVLGDTPLTKENLDSDKAYISEEDSLKKLELTIENKVESKPVLNGAKAVSWDESGLANPFASLKEADFAYENSIFVYSSVNTNFEEGIVSFLNGYGETLGALDTFSISSKNGSITFEAVLTPFQASIYGSIPVSVQRTYQGTFHSFGEDVVLPSPIEKEEDPSFEAAFKKLQSLNFSNTITNEEIKYKDGRFTKNGTASAEATPTSFSYLIRNGKNQVTDDAAYFTNDKGEAQRAVHYDSESYYASGKSLKTKISDYWPSFKISSAFFDKKDDVFTLDKKYLGLFKNTNLFTNFISDTIEDLSITVEDNKVTIINSNKGNGTSNFGNRETIVYSDFGNGQALDSKSVVYDSSPLLWSEILRDKTSYADIATYVGGSDNMNLIPVFGGIYSEATSTEMNGIYFLSAQVMSKEEGNELTTAYAKTLQEKGFVEEADGSDINYVKTLSDGKKLTLAPLVYEQQASISTSYGIFAGALVQVSE